MNTFLNIVISNVFVATCLFALLMLFRHRIKNPALFHAFLLLILVKLITPAYWQPKLELLPSTPVNESEIVDEEITFQSPLKTLLSDRKSSDNQKAVPDKNQLISQNSLKSSDATVSAEETYSQAEQSLTQTEHRKEEFSDAWFTRLTSDSEYRTFVITRLILVGWLIGTAVWFLLSVWRIVRFQRFLSRAQPASEILNQMAAALAARIGLKRVPKIELIDDNVSPLLWACFSRARIIVPVGLLEQLDDAECETILLHELAHYRRGDHCVRLVELLATGVYWWCPTLWFVRRQIRVAEEQCCDAWVVHTLPEKRRSYAEVLVKAISYVSRPTRVTGATGIGSACVLEQRLKRIMCDSLSGKISRRVKICVAVIGVMLLSFAPMLGQPLTKTVLAEEKETLPTPEEILVGYHANFKKMMPIAMNYRIRTIENMNCIHFDRRQLKGVEVFLELDRTEFNNAIKKSAGQIPNDEYYRMVMMEFVEKKKRFEGQLTPDAIKSRLAGWVTNPRYFWTDGTSFHRRDSMRKTDQEVVLDPESVSPPANLKTHYGSINMASWSKNNSPPGRVWFGVNSSYADGQGWIGDDLNKVYSFKTLAPLGLREFNWKEKLDWDNLDSFMSNDPRQYQVIRREDFNGRPTILVDRIYTPPVELKRLRSRIRAWVDPDQGYLPLRIEWARIDSAGKVVRGIYHYVEVLEVKKVVDGYYPVRIKFQEYTSDSLAIEKQIEEIGVENLGDQPPPPLPSVPGRTKIWEVTEFTPNKVVDPAVLALEFPKGAYYRNDIDGRQYHTGEPKPLSLTPEFIPKLQKGDLAPLLQVASWSDGKSRKLSDFRGNVVVVLFMDISGAVNSTDDQLKGFIDSMKLMKQIYKKNTAKGVIFLDIHPVGTTVDQIRKFQKQRQWESLAAIDAGTQSEGGLTFKKYNTIEGEGGIGAFLIGRDGRLSMSTDLMAEYDFETYYHYAARKLSISLDEQEHLSEEEAILQSMRIMEFIINELIDKALAKEVQ